MQNGNVSSEVITTYWNGYGFKIISKTDYPPIHTHLHQNFYRDEPTNEILGVTDERLEDCVKKVSAILDLKQDSFYVYPLDEPAKIAAVLIIWRREKDKELPSFQIRSSLSKTTRNCYIQLKKRYNIHERRGVSLYPEISHISTDKAHRGKGLATEMYLKAITILKSKGYPFVSSSFSNPWSRRIGARLGFKEVSRMDFNEFKNEDGTCLFGEAGNDHFVIDTVLDLH